MAGRRPGRRVARPGSQAAGGLRHRRGGSACGTYRPVPPGLASALLPAAALLVIPNTRPGLFADPVRLPGSACPGDQLVAFLGRQPRSPAAARSSTIAESTGRATMFLSAVSGGLVALGLVATAAKAGAAFYMFGLILLPTLAFVGLATFHRVLQSGIEDLAYARRIAQLRDYYFDHAPEVTGYLPSPAEGLPAPGLGIGLWQQFVTVAGMVSTTHGTRSADCTTEPFSCAQQSRR